jgi:voltage-gated potassium channel
MYHSLYVYFLRLHPSVRLFLIAITFILFFGGIIHLIEPENFSSVFDGIWWAIITASTVGYGDMVPKTTLGKVMGIILIFLGAGFISAYFFSLASTAISKHNQFVEGKLGYYGEGHMIIIGWNERSREIILDLVKKRGNQSVILIDETLKESPLPEKTIHFIQGRPSKDEVLLQANIRGAKKVLVTADQHKDEFDADMNSILTLIAIKGVCPEVFCIVEVLTTDQVKNAKRAGADSIIQTNQIISKNMIEMIMNET